MSDDADRPYWGDRQDFRYYSVAAELARRHAPAARSALDVGARDTPFLERVTWVSRKVALDDDVTPTVAGAENLRRDFLVYDPPEPFDLVFCLQVLEHLDHPRRFLGKLLRTGRVVVVSVPHRWPAGQCEDHTQDPVDGLKLQRWAGRRWVESQVVEDDGRERLVAVFTGGGDIDPFPALAAVPLDRGWLPPLLADIAATAISRRRVPFADAVTIRVEAEPARLAALAGGPGAYLAHVLWDALGFDDRRALGWRLDHKLVQAAVLDHFVPGAPPRSWGLGELARAAGHDALFDALLTGRLFVKRVVGHMSGDGGYADATGEALRRLWDGENVAPASTNPADEAWVVQERISIADEIRVHSFEEVVVPGLTYRRYGPGVVPPDRDRVNAYVQGLLDRLPAGIVGQSLLGWDVARTPDGGYRVIEVNVAGTHAAYCPGFQVSGFFQTHPLGPPLMAELLRFIERQYRLTLDLPGDWGDFPQRYPRYERLLRHHLTVPSVPEPQPAPQATFDAVLAFGAADLPRFAQLRRSLDRAGAAVGTLWVACPAADVPTVTAAVGVGVEVVAEEDLVPEAAGRRARGLARLALVERTAGRYCLDLAPDVLCVRRFTPADLLPGGKGRYYRSWNGDEEPYREVAAALGRPWPGWVHDSTPCLYCRPAVAALLEHLSALGGRPDGWSEYLLERPAVNLCALYFAFVESAGLDAAYHTPDADRLAGNDVWGADDWPDWEPRDSVGDDEPFYFSVVRPGPGVNPQEIAGRLAEYLG